MTHEEILAMIPKGYRASIEDGILHIQGPEYIGIVLKETTFFTDNESVITIRTNGTSVISLWKEMVGTHTLIL